MMLFLKIGNGPGNKNILTTITKTKDTHQMLWMNGKKSECGLVNKDGSVEKWCLSTAIGWLVHFFSYFDIYADFPFDLRKYPHLVEFSLCAYCHELFQPLWKRAANYHRPIWLARPLSIRNQLIRQKELGISTRPPNPKVCCIANEKLILEWGHKCINVNNIKLQVFSHLFEIIY